MSGGEIDAVPEVALGELMEGDRGDGSTERPSIAQDRSNVAARAVITGSSDRWRKMSWQGGLVVRAARAAGAIRAHLRACSFDAGAVPGAQDARNN